MVGNHGNFNSNVLYFSSVKTKENETKWRGKSKLFPEIWYETKIKYRYTITRIFCKEAERYICVKK